MSILQTPNSNCKEYNVGVVKNGTSEITPKRVKVCSNKQNSKNMTQTQSLTNTQQNSQQTKEQQTKQIPQASREKQSGGSVTNQPKCKPSEQTITTNGRTRRVYLGKRGGRYIKIKDKQSGKFVFKPFFPNSRDSSRLSSQN